MQFMHIKRFIDKMSVADARQNKDLVLPITDARGLRDDVLRLLSDLYAINTYPNKKPEIISVQVKGGTFT